MEEKFTKRPKLFTRFEKGSRADALRILALTLFLPFYAVIAFSFATFGSLWLDDYFPTLSYFLDDFLPILMLAIPYIIVILLLV